MDTILIIDDDPLMVDVLREMLEHAGYDVRTALGGADGIKAYHDSQANVVITDLIMPNKDGVSVIADLKKEFPGSRIIAMSGTPDVEKYAKAVAAEVNRIIIKPFESDELLDAVAQLIDSAAPAST